MKPTKERGLVKVGHEMMWDWPGTAGSPGYIRAKGKAAAFFSGKKRIKLFPPQHPA